MNLQVGTFIVPLMLAAMGCSAAELKIKVGDQGYPSGPMSFVPKRQIPPGNYMLTAGSERKPIQIDRTGRMWWWQEALEPGQSIRYQIGSLVDPTVLKGEKGAHLKKVGDDRIDITIDGKPFTTLNFKKNESKPYLYPVIGPTGDGVTRSYPMKDVEGERKDHPHHRSLWCAHGDIRVAGREGSSNYWHEKVEDGKLKSDRQVVTKITRLTTGPVFARIELEIDWVNAKTNKRDFSETRTYTFFAANEDCRIIDVTNVFHFTEGAVTFGDTKEGGIMALRIATSMDEKDPGKGRMFNSNGGEGKDACWGKAAAWCDYVGPVNGQQVGIAVFDHPQNYGHPSHWHIRDYGLYTANAFGLKNFEGEGHNGSKTWKKGENVEWNYRVYIHKGDTKAAKVADEYRLYTTSPQIAFE